MRRSSLPGGGAMLLLLAASLVAATPYPRDLFHNAGYAYLEARDCPNSCGADGQYCCDSSETCTTLDGNIATCVARGANVGYLTTTWTETRTYTSTKMTLYEPAPAPTGTEECKPTRSDWEACGLICCAGWQTCASKGQCSPKSGLDGIIVTVTSNGQVTTQYSAPYRITGTTTVVTSGVRPTESQTSSQATETGDSDGIGAGGGDSDGGGGLSAGAIAGIVIGSLVGVGLLLLLCFCCIARGLWAAIFGRKKKHHSKERVDIYEEGYSRHGSAAPHARRDRHHGWFGGGGRPSSAGGRTEKKSSGKRWLGLAGLAATMLALLNLRKDKKPDHRAGSRYSNSYYSYSDTTGTHSSSSGGRRSHRTGASRHSRATRSRYTGSPRR